MDLYSSQTDQELIHLLKNGGKDAFTALYDRYWEKLLVYTMRAVQLRADAEDIVQELFVSVWKRRNELDIRQKVSTYLYNSARYMAFRHIEQNVTRSGH